MSPHLVNDIQTQMIYKEEPVFNVPTNSICINYELIIFSLRCVCVCVYCAGVARDRRVSDQSCKTKKKRAHTNEIVFFTISKKNFKIALNDVTNLL